MRDWCQCKAEHGREQRKERGKGKDWGAGMVFPCKFHPGWIFLTTFQASFNLGLFQHSSLHSV